MADLSNLFSNIQAGCSWLFSLFATFIDTIKSNDLLLYPVLFAIAIASIYLVIRIVRAFGMKSRKS